MRNLSLTCKHITNQRRLFNSRISIRVTHQALQKDLSRGGGGGALRLLRTNSSKKTFEENIKNFESHLKCKGYPTGVTKKKNTFSERKSKLEQKNKAARKKILPFVTQYQPALPSLKKILVAKWHLIQNQPRLKKSLRSLPSSHIGKSLKDLLVRAKL